MNFNLKDRLSKAMLCALIAAICLGFGHISFAQESPKEEDFFRIMRLSTPEGIILEVGGLTILPNGDLGVSTRRGEVYIVENPTAQRLILENLHRACMRYWGLLIKTVHFTVHSGESLPN